MFLCVPKIFFVSMAERSEFDLNIGNFLADSNENEDNVASEVSDECSDSESAAGCNESLSIIDFDPLGR